MDRNRLKKDIMECAGGKPFITVSRLARCLGRQGTYVKRLLAGVGVLPPDGVRGAKYHVDDVVACK